MAKGNEPRPSEIGTVSDASESLESTVKKFSVPIGGYPVRELFDLLSKNRIFVRGYEKSQAEKLVESPQFYPDAPFLKYGGKSEKSMPHEFVSATIFPLSSLKTTGRPTYGDVQEYIKKQNGAEVPASLAPHMCLFHSELLPVGITIVGMKPIDIKLDNNRNGKPRDPEVFVIHKTGSGYCYLKTMVLSKLTRLDKGAFILSGIVD